MNRAVFLDRDGTLNVERHYVCRWEDFAWIRGAPEAIRRLNEANFRVIVLTNQAAVAHGLCTEADVMQLHARMQLDLARYGAHIDAFYYCPFHPDAAVAAYRRHSAWRKPGLGMFERAMRDWRIDPRLSFVVGDKNTDIEPGRALGMTTLLVLTGYGAEEAAHTGAHYVVSDVAEAVDQILALCATSPSKIA
ncbi:MAG: HAD family hydrolase [Bacteroidota bacterium]|nr:HAD family hydrolase [Bacteroidota bacterium]MDW8136893.1 HAD family hydrolase [Bacteroidota bacterium]